MILQTNWNPYYEAFCGFSGFHQKNPCDDLNEPVYFRQHIGKEGIEKNISVSVKLYGKQVEAKEVIVYTTVEKKQSPNQQMVNWQ